MTLLPHLPLRHSARDSIREGRIDLAAARPCEPLREGIEVEGEEAGENLRSLRPADSDGKSCVQRRGKPHGALSNPLVMHGKLTVSEADAIVKLEPTAQAPVNLELERLDVVP